MLKTELTLVNLILTKSLVVNLFSQHCQMLILEVFDVALVTQMDFGVKIGMIVQSLRFFSQSLP